MNANPPPIPSPSWPLWQRIAFRYVVCHWLLYAFPRPFMNFFGTVSGLWREFLPEGESLPPWAGEWMGSVFEWLGKPEEWWQELTTWLSDKHWSLGVEVIHQRTGSGDTGHDFVRLLCIVVFAMLLTAFWTLLDRRPKGHPVLGRWFHLAVRWDLAFWMLSYGGIKLYSGQFGEPGLWRLTREIGETSPMGMTWTFMGAMPAYEVFAGLGELLGGVLLFHRRTALLGCMVLAAVLTNVCAVNWLYDVPVKLFSMHLLLYAVVLMAPWAPRLWAMLITNRFSESVDMAVVHRWWLSVPLTIFGILWAGGTLYLMHTGNTRLQEMRTEQRARPELWGIWDIETMLRDGQQVSPEESARWKYFAIDDSKRAYATTYLGTRHSFQYIEDLAANTITLTPSGGGEPEVWTVERGTKTVNAPYPEPRTEEELRGSTEVERATLVLEGKWNGQAIELQTVRRVFELHRGFHWIQEFPRNR